MRVLLVFGLLAWACASAFAVSEHCAAVASALVKGGMPKFPGRDSDPPRPIPDDLVFLRLPEGTKVYSIKEDPFSRIYRVHGTPVGYLVRVFKSDVFRPDTELVSQILKLTAMWKVASQDSSKSFVVARIDKKVMPLTLQLADVRGSALGSVASYLKNQDTVAYKALAEAHNARLAGFLQEMQAAGLIKNPQKLAPEHRTDGHPEFDQYKAQDPKGKEVYPGAMSDVLYDSHDGRFVVYSAF